MKRFPLWNELNGIFADRTASRPLATASNEDDEDVSVVLLERESLVSVGEEEEEGDEVGEEAPNTIREATQRRGVKKKEIYD